MPPFVIRIAVTVPPETMAVAAAPLPPPPLNETAGAVVKPVPPLEMLIAATDVAEDVMFVTVR